MRKTVRTETMRWVHALCLCDQLLWKSGPEISRELAKEPESHARYLAMLEQPPAESPSSEAEDAERKVQVLAIENAAMERIRTARAGVAATWRCGEASQRLQTEWWRVGEAQARASMEELGLTVKVEEEEKKAVVRLMNDGGEILSYEEVETVKEGIQEGLLLPGVFDYEGLVTALIRVLVRVVDEKCAGFLDTSRVREIYGRKTVPFGEEWSAPFDVAFQGGGDHGNEVAYPDANEFNGVLVEYYDRLCRVRGRIFVDFFARCLKACSHEIVHCLQARAGQVDGDPLSWSAEHDASFLSGSLMAAAKGDPSLQQLGDGWWEWLLLEWGLECEHQHFRSSGYALKQYARWRDSFGLQPPAPDTFRVRDGVSLFFKNAIAFEALTADPDLLQLQLEACFKGRAGDVYSAPIAHLDQVRIKQSFQEIFQR
ncbi:MAG: hypothetical protein Q8P67_25700 [archaeon]|nr:hypothetical protein [archaeon]